MLSCLSLFCLVFRVIHSAPSLKLVYVLELVFAERNPIACHDLVGLPAPNKACFLVRLKRADVVTVFITFDVRSFCLIIV